MCIWVSETCRFAFVSVGLKAFMVKRSDFLKLLAVSGSTEFEFLSSRCHCYGRLEGCIFGLCNVLYYMYCMYCTSMYIYIYMCVCVCVCVCILYIYL